MDWGTIWDILMLVGSFFGYRILHEQALEMIEEFESMEEIK